MQLKALGSGVLRGTLPQTRGEVLDRWAADLDFACAFSRAIAATPFAALYFETPCWTTASLGEPFECVFVDRPPLTGLRADPAPFAAKLRGAAAVATFQNVGGDAVLVAPSATAGVDCAHLAAFLRTAGDDQMGQLWCAVALAARGELEQGPRWISTAGLGVSWLHVRIDRAPKYYRHAPYRPAA